MRKDLLIMLSVFALALATPIQAAGSTNVSLLYGWNGTNFVPVNIASDGSLMTTLNMTRSIGLNPSLNNTYDLGSTSLLWANLYTRSIRGGSGPLSLFSGEAERVTVLAGGNVGVGTTTPGSKLEIAGGNVNVSAGNLFVTGAFLINGTAITGDNNVSIMYGTNQSSGNPISVSLNGNGALKMSVEQSSIDAAAACNSDATCETTNLATTGTASISGGLNVTAGGLVVAAGNVGIGTTAPSQRLMVVKNSTTAYDASTGAVNIIGSLNNGDTDTNGMAASLQFVTGGADETYIGAVRDTAYTNAADIFFNVRRTNTRVEAMRILSNGNVGIGATGPTVKLHINGTSGTAAELRMTTNSGNTGGTISFYEGVTPAWNISTRGAGNEFYIYDAFNGKNVLTVKANSGNPLVGIRTTSPVGALDVNGSLASTAWTDVSFASGWSNYGGGYQNVQYKKFGDLVFLRGLANSGVNAWSTYDTIFTLPTGHRPAGRLIFGQEGNSDARVRVDISTSGAVFWVVGGAGSGWISLDGIVFSVD